MLLAEKEIQKIRDGWTPSLNHAKRYGYPAILKLSKRLRVFVGTDRYSVELLGKKWTSIGGRNCLEKAPGTIINEIEGMMAGYFAETASL